MEISTFLSIEQIKRIFSLARTPAKKIYNITNEIDEKELGNYHIELNKVRITNVLKVIGINMNDLNKINSLRKVIKDD